jgi:cell division protein FtsB
MRRIPLILAALILLLQYPLWFGKGGWLKVWELDREVEAQNLANQKMQARNAVTDAEVRDLKQGTAAIEARARNDLGMIKPGEVYFQLDDAPLAASAPAPAAAASSQTGAAGPVNRGR